MKMISIIVPVYNVVQYLDQCVSSLVHQSYSAIEILLIDDGSSDGSAEICDEWSKKDSRVRVFHTENRGVAHARNIGLTHAKGNYIGFVDSDDWVDIDMYETMMAKLISAQAEVCGSGFVHEYESRSVYPLKAEIEQIMTRDTAVERIFDNTRFKLLDVGVWDKLFSRDVLGALRFREDIAIGEDMLFFWQAMKRVKTFVYVPLFKYHYRMRIGSAMNSSISEKKITLIIAIKEIMASVAEENVHIRKILEERYCDCMITVARDMVLLDKERYKKDIVHMQQYIRKKLFSILCYPSFSRRMRLGAIYFCLPYWLCVSMSDMIKPKTKHDGNK